MCLTRTERATLLSLCKRIAYCADRASESSHHDGRAYHALRKTIRENEKGHRRFAPAGWRHLFSVEQAADFFVARTLSEGWGAPDKLLSEFAELREDYVQAALLMCRQNFRDNLRKYLDEEFPGEAPLSVLNTAGGIDYAALSGTATKLDPETQAALQFARKVAR